MKSKIYFLFVIYLFSISFLFSQNTGRKDYKLKWKDNSLIISNDKRQISLPLVENNSFDENNIPTYFSTFKVGNGQFVQSHQINNVTYSTVPSNLLSFVNIDRIPTEISSELQIGTSKDYSYAKLTITPLIKQNNQIKKVESFTLDYTFVSQNNNQVNKAPIPVYKTNSVLANGTWYKFSVDTTGVFKIDENLLKEIGISTSGLNPKDIRIYGNGGNLLPQLNGTFRYDDLQEIAIKVVGEDDNSFDAEDYILFYAKGPESWEINYQNFELTKHVTNIYSDKAFYFISVDQGPGKRISNANEILQTSDVIINEYQDFLVHELEKINRFSNGQQWLGEDFSFNEVQNFRFEFNDLVSSKDLTMRLRGVASAFSTTQMTAKLNGQELVVLNFNALSENSYNLAIPDEAYNTTNSNQEQLDIEITYNNNGNPSSIAHLDYIEILGTKNLTADNKPFGFRNISAINENLVYEYTIQNEANIYEVWDVSDHLNPKNINNQSSNTEFIFKSFGGEEKEYSVLHPTEFLIPESLENNLVPNQNLHKLQNIEYLVITQRYLLSEANRLVDYHKEFTGLNSIAVDVDQIYNEFGSGSPDLTAIRDFIRFLFLNATDSNKRIKYVCLFGDTSYDYKDRITNNNNIIPAFQSFQSFNLVTSYVTDDYFGMMDENEGELKFFELQDVATGRFPVTTVMEAKQVVDKTLNYYSSNTLGDWRNTLTFVADDPDNPNEFVLQETVDKIAEDIRSNRPEFNLIKIYSDAHKQVTTAGGEKYPTVNDAITNNVEKGTLVMDYFGHGGINGWANEGILTVPQIQAWTNKNSLPLFITVTCDFSKYDNPLQQSAGEYTLLNNHGGATSMISTTREIFISIGQLFNQSLVKKLFSFNDEDYTISEALMYTKHEFPSVQRFFIYNFGDPAMKLAQAKPNIVITQINDIDITQSMDTLKALSQIKINGVITDQDNNIINDFNGSLSATIYDKPLDKKTLDNDNFGKVMDFTSIESKVFRGRASVNNGGFSFSFIVPKDIRIAYGKAKISLYADNQQIDKSGYNLDVTIGGIDPNAPEDNEGPTVRLFMNDESFIDGGNTNESPIIYAILEDNSGINTSITSVDHDIIAILDNDDANPFVLNDYYETELDNYKKGKVKFPLHNLEPGLHTLKFKCWDTYNNPSETTLSFIVVDDSDLILSNVLNYPNPFVNYTEFWFNHNKPNESLDVQIQIFTVSGKLIKTLNQSVQSDGLLSREISWNGLDDFGNKIGKGVYVYKLLVRSMLSNTKAIKIEKLVVLQ